MTAWVASALAASGLLLVRPPRLSVEGSSRAVLVLLALAAGLAAWLGREQLPLLLLLAGATAGGGALVRSRRRVEQADATARSVQEVCEVLAAELAAGLPPVTALAASVEVWPPLGGVAEAARLGGSVPEAFRQLAAGPGARDLRLVAAAWSVAHQSGAGLAAALDAVAATLRDREATRLLIRGELASARSTARLVAALPVLTLGMGSGMGGAPVAFLVGSRPGLMLSAAGLGLGLAGLAWIEHIAGSVDREGD